MIQFLDDLRNVKPERFIRCPRCGYDQRGTISTWKDSCPLDGVCTECGLSWRWSELLNPRLTPPMWCVEFAHNARQIPWRSLRTLLCAYWPWKFWTTLRMTDEPRWRLVAAHLLMWGLVCYVMFAIAHGAIAWRMWHAEAGATGWAATSTITPWDCAFHATILPLSSNSPGTFTHAGLRPGTVVPHETPWRLFERYWSDWLNIILAMVAIIALSGAAFAVLPQSRRQAKVRWAHIIRIALHGSIMIVPPTLLYILALGIGDDDRFLLLVNLAGLLVMLLIPMLFIWWSTASSQYLKMRHPWGVGAAVVILSTLLTFAIVLYWQWWRNPL